MSDEVCTASINWSHGRAEIQSLGAMLAPVDFTLSDGRVVSPLHVAPWADEPISPDTAPILRALRGEWPCVPFGAANLATINSRWKYQSTQSDGVAHGFSANAHWTLQSIAESSIRARIEYPRDSDISTLERTVSGVSGSARLEMQLAIDPRADTCIPVGVHPIFRLPETTGAVQLIPGAFDEVWTYPGETGGESCFYPGERYASLRALPGRSGSCIDASRLPFQGSSEDLLLLTGTQGRFELRYLDQGYRVLLEWNAKDFPCVLLWISNRGRQQAPWSGRHLALGIEPVCAAFDLGVDISANDNPLSREGIKTAIRLSAGSIWRTSYTIAAELYP
ncbi:MAG: hypothetical protein AB8B87_24710 [Granulosicoccus sp.]